MRPEYLSGYEKFDFWQTWVALGLKIQNTIPIQYIIHYCTIVKQSTRYFPSVFWESTSISKLTHMSNCALYVHMQILLPENFQ